MSEQDYIIVTVDEDSDVEIISDAASTDDVLEELDDERSSEGEDYADEDEQAGAPVNHPGRTNPNSMGDDPLCGKPQVFLEGKYKTLQGLVENMNKQIFHLCDIVSVMKKSSGNIRCGNDSASLPADRQEIQALGNSFQLEDFPELQQSDSENSPLLSKIVSTCSLQLAAEPGSSAAPPVNASITIPEEVPPPGEAIMVNADDVGGYPALLRKQIVIRHTPSTSTEPERIVLTEVPYSAENVAIDNSARSFFPTFVGNITSSNDASATSSREMVTRERSGLKKTWQLANYQDSAENDSDDDTHSFLFMPVCFGQRPSETTIPNLVEEDDSNQNDHGLPVIINQAPTQMAEAAELNTRKNTATVNATGVAGAAENNRIVLENNGNLYSFFSAAPPATSFGYLGNPRRQVKMLNIHLLTAQRKNNPKQAARYLVRHLFPREVLIASSVNASCRDRPHLDPNKMAAVREYLATMFPMYDLNENGKEWKACIANVASLIRYLNSEAQRIRHNTVDGFRLPCLSMTMNWNYAGAAVPQDRFQLPQQMHDPEERENGNSVPNRNAMPEDVRNLLTDSAANTSEPLEYLGDPNRNIRVPSSLISMAKSKSCPEQSARFLIRHLFPEEVLIRSHIYGNTAQGICALSPDIINGLREFLNDAYPGLDVSENSFCWKLCMASINDYIGSLRFDRERFPSFTFFQNGSPDSPAE
ncbi:BEN domain-containing protein 2 [Ochotona princeps]|uniref:BEN domain-containing protein 2 n=1 Tax=Ochotona princeps TaxID=9978 RepID=UPI002714BC05|nr:BEN domain-containing protein 2 [Ochotona princeps]